MCIAFLACWQPPFPQQTTLCGLAVFIRRWIYPSEQDWARGLVTVSTQSFYARTSSWAYLSADNFTGDSADIILAGSPALLDVWVNAYDNSYPGLL